jgi:LmbE family N-acetylglucosaminyl deacetylase
MVTPDADASRPRVPDRAPLAGQRWLVLAPHPDDETIASAGLLLRARAAGASVHVALLTDGGGNPWPQRWLERRWRLDAAARARWARRRREECRAALRVLGLDPDRDLTAFGWDDGRLTAAFCEAPDAFPAPLRALLAAFAPTDVVVPAADDRHPDHAVCPVMLALALPESAVGPRLHAYRVHGRSRGDSFVLALGPEELARKRAALACHATQLALSGRRFAALAGATERYDADPFGTALSRATGWPRALEATFEALQGEWRWRVVHRDGAGRTSVRTLPGRAADPFSSPDAIFTKLEAGRRGPWIYDSHGWRRAGRVR